MAPLSQNNEPSNILIVSFSTISQIAELVDFAQKVEGFVRYDTSPKIIRLIFDTNYASQLAKKKLEIKYSNIRFHYDKFKENLLNMTAPTINKGVMVSEENINYPSDYVDLTEYYSLPPKYNHY